MLAMGTNVMWMHVQVVIIPVIVLVLIEQAVEQIIHGFIMMDM